MQVLGVRHRYLGGLPKIEEKRAACALYRAAYRDVRHGGQYEGTSPAVAGGVAGTPVRAGPTVPAAHPLPPFAKASAGELAIEPKRVYRTDTQRRRPGPVRRIAPRVVFTKSCQE